MAGPAMARRLWVLLWALLWAGLPAPAEPREVQGFTSNLRLIFEALGHGYYLSDYTPHQVYRVDCAEEAFPTFDQVQNFTQWPHECRAAFALGDLACFASYGTPSEILCFDLLTGVMQPVQDLSRHDTGWDSAVVAGGQAYISGSDKVLRLVASGNSVAVDAVRDVPQEVGKWWGKAYLDCADSTHVYLHVNKIEVRIRHEDFVAGGLEVLDFTSRGAAACSGGFLHEGWFYCTGPSTGLGDVARVPLANFTAGAVEVLDTRQHDSRLGFASGGFVAAAEGLGYVTSKASPGADLTLVAVLSLADFKVVEVLELRPGGAGISMGHGFGGFAAAGHGFVSGPSSVFRFQLTNTTTTTSSTPHFLPSPSEMRMSMSSSSSSSTSSTLGSSTSFLGTLTSSFASTGSSTSSSTTSASTSSTSSSSSSRSSSTSSTSTGTSSLTFSTSTSTSSSTVTTSSSMMGTTSSSSATSPSASTTLSSRTSSTSSLSARTSSSTSTASRTSSTSSLTLTTSRSSTLTTSRYTLRSRSSTKTGTLSASTSSMSSSSSRSSTTSSTSTGTSSSASSSMVTTSSSSGSSTTSSSTSARTSSSTSTAPTTSRSSTSFTATSSLTLTTSSSSLRSRSSTSGTSSSSSTSLTSASSTSSRGDSSTTSTTSTLTQPTLVMVARALEAAMQQAAEERREVLAVPEGLVTAVRTGELLLQADASAWLQPAAGGGAQLLLTRSLLRALPQGSVLLILEFNETMRGSPEERLVWDPFADVGGQLVAPSVAITVLDAGLRRVVQLPEPLLFQLPPGLSSEEEGARCVYLDVESQQGVEWSARGVHRASNAEVRARGFAPEGLWCKTEHLSIFAAIKGAVLGCMNAELLTPQALAAITENENWWRLWPAVLWFCISAVLLACLVLGTIRERRALRLGRTHEEGKDIKICRAMLTFGPQLLKHKYAAFVVLARDLLHCMRAGREKLRLASLTAAVQRCFAVRTGVSTACISAHCWKDGAWLESTASLPHVVLCHKLDFHCGAAEEVVENELRGRRVKDVARRYAITFLASHPLLDAMRLGASSLSVRKRVTLQLAGFMGVLATNAVIFDFSGGQRHWEADGQCPIDSGSDLFVIVASTMSVLLNVLPNTFLLDVARQVHGRPGWNAFFWLSCLAYLACCTLLVAAALANLNVQDQGKWQSALEWSLAIKFLGLPAAQSLRHHIMLEHFLHEDSKSKHIEQSLGLRCPFEQPLVDNEQEAVAQLAMRAISAGELVNFFALLGDTVMPEYLPETSTSADVAAAAIPMFCQQRPRLEEAFVEVEVLEAALWMPEGRTAGLSCSVLHLGPQEGGHRVPLGLRSSPEVAPSAQGGFAWHFQAKLPAVDSDHALGFVLWQGSRAVATAHWPMEELLKGNLQRQLPLRPPAASDPKRAFRLPPASSADGDGLCPRFRGGASRWGLAPSATLRVRARLTPEYLQALARHELRKLRRLPPMHSSEVEAAAMPGLDTSLLGPRDEEPRNVDLWQSAYCDAGELPPERLVVHSMAGNFLDLVAALLSEALGEQRDLPQLRAMLLSRDFHAVLDLLRSRGRLERRYWIDLFAMRTGRHRSWHKDLVALQPWLIRAVRRECCGRMAADLRARAQPSCGLPLQLLVMDRGLCLLADSGCVCEALVAEGSCLPQELILHPEHLRGPAIGDGLQELTEQLTHEGALAAFSAVYAPAEVYLLLANLAVAAAKRQEGEASLQDLNLHDVAAVAAGIAASRGAAERGDEVQSIRSTRAGDGAGEDLAGEDVVAIDD